MAAKSRKKRKVNVEDAKQTKKFFVTTAIIVGLILTLMFVLFSMS